MGHKKRPTPPQPSPAAAPAAEASPKPAADAVKSECEKALLAFRRGNHTKALRIMKDACARFDSSPLLHRIHGTVHFKVAALLDDPSAKLRHLRSGIDSARRAVDLSPDSLEFAHFHANLLFEAASDSVGYEEVVRECERALAIADPADPARDSLDEERQHKIPTAEARIANVQQELRSLIQKSNIASISTWMKNLGGPGGEEKFRVIPMRRLTAAEDPMEVRLVQAARRPNEIKKATKTPEERRKEIEVRVAAARLLQQKPASPPPPQQQDEEGGGSSLSPPSSSGSQRLAERRKQINVRKLLSSAERMEQLRGYWNLMSEERKHRFFEVSIEELRAHLMAMKDTQAMDCLSEALMFADANGTWRFWACFKCGEKFVDAEAHCLHVERNHAGSLTPALKSVLPQEVDGEWAEMLVNSNFWKPIDIAAVEKMLEDGKPKDKPVPMDRDDLENGNKGEEHLSDYQSSRDASESSASLQDAESKVDGNVIHCIGLDAGKNIEVPEFISRENGDIRLRWPVSDDSERIKLLEKIHGMFQLLVKHKCLSAGHLNKVVQFTMEEIQGLQYGSQMVNLAIDTSPLCICFLGPSQLRKILKFLQDLSQSCGLGRYFDNNSLSDDSQNLAPESEYLEKIVLSSDSSLLCLDDRLFFRKSKPENIEISGSEDSNEMVDGSALISWLFAGPPYGEQLATWSRVREEKLQQGLENFQMLDKEFNALQNTCERKCEHISYEEALHVVENLCVEEQSRRDQAAKYLAQGYITVLKKRQEELIERENDSVTVSFQRNDSLGVNSRYELDALSNILKEAHALNASQFGYDEPLSGLTSRLCDLECGDEDDWKMQDYLHQSDTCVDVTIQRQKEQIAIELSKIDARIMRSLGCLQQLENKLGPSSAFDYRGIVLPLMRSFMRAHIEDLVDKYATEKSDAAREAFLAELARDAEKSKAKGGENPKHSQEKSKDKKRNKDSKRNKDTKNTSTLACNGDGPVEEIIEKLSISSDTDHMESDLPCSEEFLQQQEEFRKRIVEEEERKLEETLAYQRKIENEAKQRHLEEQNRRKAGNVFETTARETCNQSFQHQFSPNDPTGMLDSSPLLSLEEKEHGNVQFSEADALGVSRMTSTRMNHLSNYSDAVNGVYLDKTETPGIQHANSIMQKAGSSENISLKHKQDVKLAYETRSESHSSIAEISTRVHENGKENSLAANRKRPSTRSTTGRSSKHAETASKKADALTGENGAVILNFLHAEDDDEERFQADLKKAVSQSLDTFQAQKQLLDGKPWKFAESAPLLEIADQSSTKKDLDIESITKDVLGAGLQNEAGEYNCFLNVIIQSLWHLRRFRDEFMRSSCRHVHIGNPCVVCALYEIFSALSTASKDSQREPVAPTNLRSALSNLYPDSNFFQEAQMNDASEVLSVIFDCLHRSFTSQSSKYAVRSQEKDGIGCWDCVDSRCIAHTFFGMDIYEKMNCHICSNESRHLKYTSFFYNINANALRTMKLTSSDSNFDELLRLVEMNHQLACDIEAGGCGKPNYIHHMLSTPPQIFTTVLGWQNTSESVEAISATLSALSTHVDVGVLFQGLDQGKRHSLVSVVCYYGQHYHCFAYNHEHEEWIMYDDKTVKKIGDWSDVLSMCVKGHLQPQVLMFESQN